MTLTPGRLAALAAAVFFVVAALVAFGAGISGNAFGLAACGLGALAVAHLLP